jgi:hypothetical protein
MLIIREKLKLVKDAARVLFRNRETEEVSSKTGYILR